MTKYRKCVVCGDPFPPDRNAKTCSPECSQQRRQHTLDRYHHEVRLPTYPQRREELSAHRREVYAEQREDMLAARKARRAAVLDKANAKQRGYYAVNREAINARRRELRRIKREGAGHDRT